MSTELAVRGNGAMAAHGVAAEYGAEQLDLIKKTVAVGASDLELQMFLTYARRTGLDPIGRQIHCIKRGDKATIQVSIDGLRLIADRTGLYCGNDDAEFEGLTDDGYPAKARVTVYKMVQGTRCGFTASARWQEYAQTFTNRQTGQAYYGDLWRRMPHTMLAKCAESLALRKAFPADMSGIYTSEEMQQADAFETRQTVDTRTGEIIDARPQATAQATTQAAAPPPAELTPTQLLNRALKALARTDGWVPDMKDKAGVAEQLSSLLGRAVTPADLKSLTATDIDAARSELEHRNAQRARYYAVRAEIAGNLSDEQDRALIAELLGMPVETRRRLTSQQWAAAADALPHYAQRQASQTVPAAAMTATVDADDDGDDPDAIEDPFKD